MRLFRDTLRRGARGRVRPDAERGTTHRLAQNVGGHPIIPLPVHWRTGDHGDPIAVFDCIVLHLHRDGSVTWSDQSQAWEATDGR